MAARTSIIVELAVKLQLPPGVKGDRALRYVREAVISHVGGLDPQDPIYELDREKITVRMTKKTITYA